MFTILQAYLITVGVISAQKKMLSVLTAWEENIPMMENATENFLFKVSRSTVDRNKKGERSERKISPKRKLSPVSCRRLYFPITGFHRWALEWGRDVTLVSREDGTVPMQAEEPPRPETTTFVLWYVGQNKGKMKWDAPLTLRIESYIVVMTTSCFQWVSFHNWSLFSNLTFR